MPGALVTLPVVRRRLHGDCQAVRGADDQVEAESLSQLRYRYHWLDTEYSGTQARQSKLQWQCMNFERF